MIKTTDMLLESLKNYSNPKTKLSRMVEKHEYYPIIRGLYETDKSVPPYLLAGSICSPSYISFSFALSVYGLIPEAVPTVTSATFEKRKKKLYTTPFGVFIYRDIPSSAFPYGIRVVREGDYYYRIAEPEKALCDLLYTLSPVHNMKELDDLLFENLRIERDDISRLDWDKVAAYAPLYHSTNTKALAAFGRRIRKNTSVERVRNIVIPGAGAENHEEMVPPENTNI